MRNRRACPALEPVCRDHERGRDGQTCAELGGKVLAPPFDVMEHGRMGVIQRSDRRPVLRVAGEERHRDSYRRREWNFLLGGPQHSDSDRAKKFYEGLFGWRLFASEKDPSGYLHIQNGEEMIGGIPPAAHRSPHIPAHSAVYFLVDDVDASAAKAKAMGAAVHLAPMSMENVGRMAVLADLEGASLAIFKPSPRG